jgi:hypothetical protein
MGDSSASSNSRELQKAHEFYLAAAANRDDDPDTYEGARIRYFTLKNGEGWLQQEKTRIADTKLKPAIDDYRRQFQTLESQAAVQNKLVDSIVSARDKQSAAVDSTSSNFEFLDNFLQEKKAKMSAYDRFVELTSPSASINAEKTGPGSSLGLPIATYFASFPSSFNTILNVVIAISGLFLIVIAISKSRNLFKGWTTSAPLPTASTPLSTR